MWMVWRQLDAPGEGRMYYVGKPGNWSNDVGRVALWNDRRDAYQIAEWLLDHQPGHSGKLYTYGEEFADHTDLVRPADPKQVSPGRHHDTKP